MSGSLNKHASAQQAITSRQISIIEMLAQAAPDFVTVSVIAGKLGVSARTVLRELPDIEAWMEANGFTFVRKPSVGLSIRETAEQIQFLLKCLQAKPLHISYTRRERRGRILEQLLFADEPVKSFVLQSEYQISVGTLSADLNAIETWLSDYQIDMVRRQGAGIWLEGTEKSYRLAIANAAFEMGAEMHSEITVFIEQVLREMERDFGIRYAGSGYMALVVHISVAVRRMQDGHRIVLDDSELEHLCQLSEYAIARQIARLVEKKYSLQLSVEEEAYIAMHLFGARAGDDWKQVIPHEWDAHLLTQKLIQDAEQSLQVSFEDQKEMQKDLERHISAMLHRLTLDIRIEHPQEDMVKRDYPEIYDMVKHSCEASLAEMGDIRMNDAEVAYVAMYFAATSELLQKEGEKVAVAVVCPSGMGASRMLAASLLKHFPNLEVRTAVSAFEIDPGRLRDSDIELVISTVPLEIEYPMVCVPPILQEKDIALVRNAIADLSQGQEKAQKRALKHAAEVPGNLNLAKIALQVRVGQEILELLEHFQIQELSKVRGVEELLGYAAGMFAENMVAREIISSEFASRESLQTTFLPEIGIYLLHCRTTAVKHCRFGYLSLEQEIPIPVGMVQGAVVMLAPKDSACKAEMSECVDVISCLSVLLVEEPAFLKALQQGNQEESRSLMERQLLQLYQQKMKDI